MSNDLSLSLSKKRHGIEKRKKRLPKKHDPKK
jgi:hypothetical protein